MNENKIPKSLYNIVVLYCDTRFETIPHAIYDII